ncbi:MAG: hypothetical protein ACO1PW_11005 [Actinomycetota bacterium]
MLLWFLAPSILIVWAVFRSPGADYRTVALGALLPLIELPVGEPRILHSVVGAGALMAGVMLVFRGRRLLQRRLLGLPIGVLVHQLLDGAWADTHGFWWPLLGLDWSRSELPLLGRGLGWNLVLEGLGAAALWWLWQRFRLLEPDRRRTFLREGRVGRDIVP